MELAKERNGPHQKTSWPMSKSLYFSKHCTTKQNKQTLVSKKERETSNMETHRKKKCCTYAWLFFGAIIQNSTDMALTTMNTPTTV